MDKGFNIHILWDVITDFSDFTKRKFAGGYHTLCAHLVPEIEGTIVCIVRLCTDMTFDIRTDFLCQHKNSWVSDDKTVWSVRFHIVQFFKISTHTI